MRGEQTSVCHSQGEQPIGRTEDIQLFLANILRLYMSLTSTDIVKLDGAYYLISIASHIDPTNSRN